MTEESNPKEGAKVEILLENFTFISTLLLSQISFRNSPGHRSTRKSRNDLEAKKKMFPLGDLTENELYIC